MRSILLTRWEWSRKGYDSGRIMLKASSGTSWEFEGFEVLTAKRLLLGGGTPVPLTSKAFDTLVVLIENRDRVVTKDELLRSYNQPVQAIANGAAVLRSIGQQRYKGIDGGLLYAPDRGWRGSLTWNWIGDHWLNSLNTFEAAAYAVVDASLGYRFKKFTVALLGSNLANRRDAVQLSELGEGQFYRMPARRIDATVTWHYK
jgi:hypothetical protein